MKIGDRMTLKEQIMKLQTYKMHEGEDTVYVERDDVLKALEQEPYEDCISRQAAIDAPVKMVSEGLDWIPVYHLKDLPSVEPEHTSNNDCNGCKFVGYYNTDFPCATCIRKNKDYYAPERRTDE